MKLTAPLTIVAGIALSACASRPAATFARIALHDGKTAIDTDESGMLPRATCGKLCPNHGERSATSCSPAELVVDHPDERIVVCSGETVPRSFRFQELPEDVREDEQVFGGSACIRICGAAHTGGCQLLARIPIVEGKRFVVCRYARSSG